jgi:hypothetical protein
MIAGTEVQVLKAQDTVTAAGAVGKGQSNGDCEETSDTLNNDSNSNSNSNSNGNSNSNRSSSGQGNGQTKKKGKYSHKDSDEKDKDKNPNGTSSDNKKKKRKKYVIYTDNPAVGKVENESVEMASEAITAAEVGTGRESGVVIGAEKEKEIGTIISNESAIVNDSMSGENNNSHIIENTIITTTEEMVKVEKRLEDDIKKSDKLKIEIMEEKMRVEERKKEGLEKLLKESVLNAQKEEEEQERNEDEIELSRKGGRGTFSVGCLPKPLNCPKGNTLFPGTHVRTYLLTLP